jgi:hypothetical protein
MKIQLPWIAGLFALFTGCMDIIPDAEVKQGVTREASSVWRGSARAVCGTAGGYAVLLRFDPDSTVPDTARFYRIWLQPRTLSSLQVDDLPLVKNLPLCGGAPCSESDAIERITLHITQADDIAVRMSFWLRSADGDSLLTGATRLVKQPGEPQNCL